MNFLNNLNNGGILGRNYQVVCVKMDFKFGCLMGFFLFFFWYMMRFVYVTQFKDIDFGRFCYFIYRVGMACLVSVGLLSFVFLFLVFQGIYLKFSGSG